jgi:hypothetical protein
MIQPLKDMTRFSQAGATAKSVAPAFIITLLVALGCALLFCGCNDSDSHPEPGLQNANLCFVANGGNVSNQLAAADNWRIDIPAEASWLTVTPSSGSGKSGLINIVFTATVNNNADIREQQVDVVVGDKKSTYIASQDGLEQQSCFD